MKDVKGKIRKKLVEDYVENKEKEYPNLILKKQLSVSERDRHWIHARTVKNKLPPTGEKFKLLKNNKSIETYLDKYGRIRIGSDGFRKFNIPKERSTICLYETENHREYILKIKKQ